MVGRLINLDKETIPIGARNQNVGRNGLEWARCIGESALVDLLIPIFKKTNCHHIGIGVSRFVIWIIEPARDLKPDFSERQYLTRHIAQDLYSTSEVGGQRIRIKTTANEFAEIVPSAWKTARKIVTELSNLLGVGQF